MAAVAALLSLCFGALPPCPSAAGPQCIGELARGPRFPRQVAVSPDDTLAAVPSYDGKTGLYVYNVSTGAALTVPSYPSTYRLAFSPDGDKLAVTLEDRAVAVISLSSGTELWSDNTKGGCASVAYSPDAVACGHDDGNITIWNAVTGALLLTLTGGHTAQVTTLTYTVDGGRLISAADDKKVVVWDATTGTVLKQMYTVGVVSAIRVSPDGLYFAPMVRMEIDPVRIYKLSDYSLHKEVPLGIYNYAISFNHDWSRLVALGQDTMRVYLVDRARLSEVERTPSGTNYAVSYFHKSDTIITAEWQENAGVQLWADLAAPIPEPPALPPCPVGTGPHCIAELARGPFGYPFRVAVSPDDTLAAVAALDTGLHVYNVATGAAVTVPSYPSALEAAFSPDGNKVAVALESGGVAVVSLSSGTELWRDNTKGPCLSVAYSPDGTRVASGHSGGGYYDNRIHIWNATTGGFVKELLDPLGHLTSVSTLAYTVDGGRLISGSRDSRVAVWDMHTGKILKTLTDSTTEVLDIQVSPDGLYFASVDSRFEDTVNIYNLSDYSLIKKINPEADYKGVSFNHDWSKLAVVGDYRCREGRMKVYMVESGTLAQSYLLPSLTSRAVSYFHKSDTIITAEYLSSNAGIQLWEDLATPAPTQM